MVSKLTNPLVDHVITYAVPFDIYMRIGYPFTYMNWRTLYVVIF